MTDAQSLRQAFVAGWKARSRRGWVSDETKYAEGEALRRFSDHPPKVEKRWKVLCEACGATEEGSKGEVPLRLHGRLENGQWQHYVANAFTAHEWCGPVVRAHDEKELTSL